MTAQARRKLAPESVVTRARELAALRLPSKAIAAGLGVHRSTLNEWRATEPARSAAIN